MLTSYNILCLMKLNPSNIRLAINKSTKVLIIRKEVWIKSNVIMQGIKIKRDDLLGKDSSGSTLSRGEFT